MIMVMQAFSIQEKLRATGPARELENSVMYSIV
jgi:hypothetical protein